MCSYLECREQSHIIILATWVLSLFSERHSCVHAIIPLVYKYSLKMAMCGMYCKRPQEHWIGTNGNHRRHPLPSYRLLASARITGYRRSVCRPGSSRIDSVRGGRTRNSIIGEATFRSQSASEWAISTSRQSLVQIQYLYPSLAGRNGWRAPVDFVQYHVRSASPAKDIAIGYSQFMFTDPH